MTEDATLLEPLLALLRGGVREDDRWLKAIFSHPAGDAFFEKLVAQPVRLTSGAAIKLVVSNQGRVATRTLPLGDWPAELEAVLGAEPSHINLLARDHDWHARRAKSGRWLVSRGKPSQVPRGEPAAVAAHDRQPNHPLPPDDDAVRELFVETGLFGHSGKLRGEAAGKYRQVQHYVELLRPLGLWERPAGSAVRIIDAGCGKAYLSLALYLYAKRRGLRPELHAVDREPSVIGAVATAAEHLGYIDVHTHAADIASFAATLDGGCDLLVSLHACDTATDDALGAGVSLGAKAIVLAPCCHHELVAQVEARMKDGRAPAGWDAILGSGLLRHRFADVLTDALRAAALEACGYRADVVEFVDPEATSRNLMIRAERRPEGSGLEMAKAAGVASFRGLAAAWDVQPSVQRVVASPEP